MKQRIYVGIRNGKRFVFKSESTPTQRSHGKLYDAVIGPFRTKRAAVLMVVCGSGNPHLQHVLDAERIASRLSAQPEFSSDFEPMIEIGAHGQRNIQ